MGYGIVEQGKIRLIDLTHLEELSIKVYACGSPDPIALHGSDAVDFVMRTCPGAFEGRRLRWVKHAWAVHNLIGHPVMQLCAWVGLTKLGLRIHDATVPQPRGGR